MMGRKRKSNKDLPRRVYIRNGTYWFVTPQNKWVKLGRTKFDMYNKLAELSSDRPGTMLEHFQRYERDIIPKKAASTQYKQRRHMVKLKSVFGKMLPTEITPRHVAMFLRNYPAPIAANQHITLLSDVYSTMISWWLVDGVESNPCTGIKRNPQKPRNRYVKDGEFWAVWEKSPHHIQMVMELSYLTGLRRFQLVDLKYSDFKEDGLHIDAGKGGKKLILEWTPKLRDVIKRSKAVVPHLGGWVVRNKHGRHLAPKGIEKAWMVTRNKCLEDGTISESFTFHDIRAKSATDHESGKHLGHQDAKTLEKFYRRKPTVVRGL